jgi:hypothetical protein
MRKIWPLPTLAAALACAAVTLAAQSAPSPAATGYLTPPKVIADLMEAEPLPAVSLSPDRAIMLLAHRKSMPGIAEVAAPFLGLAGARVNPRTNGTRALGGTVALTLKDVATGTERKLVLPSGGTFAAAFSRDSRKIAITHTTDNGIRLLVADVATAAVRPVVDGGINGLAGGCSWLDDSSGFLCRLIPEGRGAPPVDAGVPAGPNIQQNLGGTAPGRTYQDLLTSAHEERLYDFYYTSQPAFVSLDGKKSVLGSPAVYASLSLSTDGQWIVVTRVKRP